MRHVRMLGPCLIAALAVAAVAATNASALPEWGKCEAQPEHLGKYTDADCTKKAAVNKATGKAEGEFEFKKGKELKPVKFSGGSVGSGGVLSTNFRECRSAVVVQFARTTRAGCHEKANFEEREGESVVSVECESEHNTGEAVGTNEVHNVSVKFLGCKALGSFSCSNGPNEGEIVINPLKGKLGYIKKSTKEVGLLLEPAKAKGEFAKFDCAGLIEIVVGAGNSKEGAEYTSKGCKGLCPGTTPTEEAHGGYDGIISQITPVNTMTSEYTQVFTVNKETLENIPSKFEGKHIELLEDYDYIPENPEFGSDFSPAGEEITNVNTASEPGEIKA